MAKSRYGTRRVRDLPSIERDADLLDIVGQFKSVKSTAGSAIQPQDLELIAENSNAGLSAYAETEELKRQLRVLEDKLRLENLGTSALFQVEDLKRRLRLLEDKFAHITLVAMNSGRGDERPQFKNVRATTVQTTLLTKTSSYAVVSGEASIYIGNAVGGAVTFTLPATASCVGLVLTFKKSDASGNAVIVDGDGSETIDGATTKSIGTQYHSITIVANGIGWSIIGELD